MSKETARKFTGKQRCQMKATYPDWVAAEAACLSLYEDKWDGKATRQGKPGCPVVAYMCFYCGGWHIGHCPIPGNAYNNWHRYLVKVQRAQAYGRVPSVRLAVRRLQKTR